MAPSDVPGFPRGQISGRRDLRANARMTVTMLAGIIALNLVGIAAGTARDWPGFLDMVWLVLFGITGTVFLTWFARARRNTASYGPDRVRAYPQVAAAAALTVLASPLPAVHAVHRWPGHRKRAAAPGRPGSDHSRDRRDLACQRRRRHRVQRRWAIHRDRPVHKPRQRRGAYRDSMVRHRHLAGRGSM